MRVGGGEEKISWIEGDIVRVGGREGGKNQLVRRWDSEGGEGGR